MSKSYKLSKPIKMSDKEFTHFEMRESTVEDMFDAEMQLSSYGGGVHTPLLFNGEMMIRQLSKVSNAKGDHFDGPFTMNMLKTWGKHNYTVLRAAQVEIDNLGEGSQSEEKTL
jgi:phage FluMu protein gp41